MQVEMCGLTDVGKRREKNEDSFLVRPDLLLCMVADGMGGHLGGDHASRMATETIDEILGVLERDPEVTLEEGAQVIPGDYTSYLRYALSMASERIFHEASAKPQFRGMGTTAVIALFRQNAVFIAHVGDSRGYSVRGGRIRQVTEDHSLVGEQIRAGFLTADDARSHRLKNVITRSVGFQGTVDADIHVNPVRPGDRYILCSDGLSNMVSNQEIGDVVSHNGVSEACQRLVDIANERGGEDNITVVIAEVKALGTAAAGADDSTLDIND